MKHLKLSLLWSVGWVMVFVKAKVLDDQLLLDFVSWKDDLRGRCFVVAHRRLRNRLRILLGCNPEDLHRLDHHSCFMHVGVDVTLQRPLVALTRHFGGDDVAVGDVCSLLC